MTAPVPEAFDVTEVVAAVRARIEADETAWGVPPPALERLLDWSEQHGETVEMYECAGLIHDLRELAKTYPSVEDIPDCVLRFGRWLKDHDADAG